MTAKTHQVRILLIGLGNLGRRFAGLISTKHDQLMERYGLDLRLVGVADSRGAAIDPQGLDGAEIERWKEAGKPVSSLAGSGRPGMTGLELIETVEANILCEAGPVNFGQDGEPGLSHVRTALRKGLHVATPNKGPIVLAYRELLDLAENHGVRLRFDGTVAGGLPALDLGQRDLRGAEIRAIESVPNLTTGYILDMLADGVSWNDALEQARDAGALEADPTWDLDGWDAASKLAILANAVLGLDVTIHEIERTGITELSPEWLRTERSEGRLVRLVASARRDEQVVFMLRRQPRSLPSDHPFAHLGQKQMAVLYETDLFGTIVSSIDEQTPLPSAATMLRDLLAIMLERK